MTSHEKVSSIFRTARKLRGKTQVEVAKHLGVSQSCISKIEAGKLLPSVSEWFLFTELVEIRADESYHYGYLDQALPVQESGAYAGSSFKLPEKYVQHDRSKVRTALPFIQHFVDHYGAARWRSYLAKEKMDPDFFLVYDGQLSPQFSLDLATRMIEGGVLKPNSVEVLARHSRNPAMHGRLQQEYSQLTRNRDLVVTLINGIERYEANFDYQWEEQSTQRLTLSVTPHEHMKDISYRNDTLGDFVCRYRKNYLTEFSTYSGDRPVAIEEKECHFHGSRKCVYQIQTVS